MSDHPVLVATSIGPIAGIVSDPERPPRAALLLLQGEGRPGRSGVNAVWTSVARDLADAGVLVVRFEYPGEGDGTMISKRALSGIDTDHHMRVVIAVLPELMAWLREQAGIQRLLTFGDCVGGRVALEVACDDPDVVGTFLTVPYVRAGFVEPEKRRVGSGGLDGAPGRTEPDSFDPRVLEGIPRMLERGPVWILTGDGDGDEAQQIKRLLGRRGHKLEIEVVPDMTLHPVGPHEVQREVSRRLKRRLLRAVDELEPAAGQPSATAGSAPAR